jgi:hypothetical protein
VNCVLGLFGYANLVVCYNREPFVRPFLFVSASMTHWN